MPNQPSKNPDKKKLALNVDIPSYLPANIREEAKASGISVASVVTIALQNFFCLKKAERVLLYRSCERKSSGRPIKK
jgi:hypothetical protein